MPKHQPASTQGSGFLRNDLALTLLEAGVLLVDDVELTVATDDFAINATFLHRGFYFHDLEKNEKIICNDILCGLLTNHKATFLISLYRRAES